MRTALKIFFFVILAIVLSAIKVATKNGGGFLFGFVAMAIALAAFMAIWDYNPEKKEKKKDDDDKYSLIKK